MRGYHSLFAPIMALTCTHMLYRLAETVRFCTVPELRLVHATWIACVLPSELLSPPAAQIHVTH